MCCPQSPKCRPRHSQDLPSKNGWLPPACALFSPRGLTRAELTYKCILLLKSKGCNLQGFFLRFSLFIFREGEGKEKERERNTEKYA